MCLRGNESPHPHWHWVNRLMMRRRDAIKTIMVYSLLALVGLPEKFRKVAAPLTTVDESLSSGPVSMSVLFVVVRTAYRDHY
jgi:hypothetical protein